MGLIGAKTYLCNLNQQKIIMELLYIRRNLLTFGIIAALYGIYLTGCTGTTENYAALESEVLGIHDDVMPKMDDIMMYSSRLKEKIATLDSLQQEGVSGNTVAELRVKAYDVVRQLEAADSLMMEWMYHYDADSAKLLSDSEARAYFENEKKKILDVKDKTEKSLEEAKNLLDN